MQKVEAAFDRSQSACETADEHTANASLSDTPGLPCRIDSTDEIQRIGPLVGLGGIDGIE